jgi:hypothetical protein
VRSWAACLMSPFECPRDLPALLWTLPRGRSDWIVNVPLDVAENPCPQLGRGPIRDARRCGSGDILTPPVRRESRLGRDLGNARQEPPSRHALAIA